MITVLVTGTAVVLMYLVCLRPMRNQGRSSCCDSSTDEQLADMHRQVAALRKDAQGDRSA